MPNWCLNKLNISGPAADIQKFRTQAHGHTQNYNELRRRLSDKWPINDDIRLKSLLSQLPEPGSVAALSFHALYPVPEDFRRFPYDDLYAQEVGDLVGEERPYGGYSWESNHWGVKWGACDSELMHKENCFLQYEFSTAWGPPIAFFEKISEDWPTLSFELSYEEPGMGFQGSAEWYEGSLQSSWEGEYEDDDYEEEE
jgi:hypothetical protein